MYVSNNASVLYEAGTAYPSRAVGFIRSRNCLPFSSSWVHTQFFVWLCFLYLFCTVSCTCMYNVTSVSRLSIRFSVYLIWYKRLYKIILSCMPNMRVLKYGDVLLSDFRY